ncbi:MAG: formate dehydrogenase subunit delta [Natronospirillum sp.]
MPHKHDPQLHSSIRMINQIAANQTHHDNDEQAAEAVAAHLKKFWARGMKQQIIEFAATDDVGEISAIARRATVILRDT